MAKAPQPSQEKSKDRPFAVALGVAFALAIGAMGIRTLFDALTYYFPRGESFTFLLLFVLGGGGIGAGAHLLSEILRAMRK